MATPYTVRLDEELELAVKAEAKSREVTPAEVIRASVAAYFAKPPQPTGQPADTRRLLEEALITRLLILRLADRYFGRQEIVDALLDRCVNDARIALAEEEE